METEVGQRSLDGDGAAPGRGSRFGREKVAGLGSWARVPAWAEEEVSKGGSEHAARGRGQPARWVQQQPTRLRDPEGPPKVGNTDELIFKEHVSYLFK